MPRIAFFLLCLTAIACKQSSSESEPAPAPTSSQVDPVASQQEPIGHKPEPLAPVAAPEIPFSYPAPSPLPANPIKLWATQYYVHKAKEGPGQPLLDTNEKPLGMTVSLCDFCLGAIEGTIYILDSLGTAHTFNYAKTAPQEQANCHLCSSIGSNVSRSMGKTLWKSTTGFGDGVKGYKLVPYRTIAVDPNKYKYGSVLYIPDARGKTITLPDSSTVEHDGYFFAGDTGGAIKRNHIDIFTGFTKSNPFKTFLKSDSTKTFDAFVVTDTNIVNPLERLHRTFRRE